MRSGLVSDTHSTSRWNLSFICAISPFIFFPCYFVGRNLCTSEDSHVEFSERSASWSNGGALRLCSCEHYSDLPQTHADQLGSLHTSTERAKGGGTWNGQKAIEINPINWICSRVRTEQRKFFFVQSETDERDGAQTLEQSKEHP